jgi:hypothetical protein
VISEFAPLAAALKFDLASPALLAPVPPSATARSVMPLIVPPSIFTELSAVVPATVSAICFIISRSALFIFDGAQFSSISMPPISVFEAAVAE